MTHTQLQDLKHTSKDSVKGFIRLVMKVFKIITQSIKRTLSTF